jgi:chemotaxis protein CheX
MLDEALIGVVETITATMFHVAPELAPLSSSGFDEHALTATIAFQGSFVGELRVTFTAKLARVATSFLLQTQGDVSDEDLRDAIGELTNILAWNVKGLLPAPSLLSLPRVQTGEQILVSYPSVPLGRVLFHVHGEPMWVELTGTNRTKPA